MQTITKSRSTSTYFKFQEGDPKENLVGLFNQLIDLGNLYDLWGSSMKTVCQIFARALSGKPREKWSKIVKKQASFTDNNNNCKEFIKMCQTAASKILGMKAFRNQEAAMDNTMTLPSNKPFRDSIKQYFTMNKDMKYLGEEGKSYSVHTLNKQITKMLPLRVWMEYIMSNGEEQNTKEDILDAMESLDTFVKLTKMGNASEKAVSNKSNDGNQNLKKSNNKSNREANQGSINQQKSNPCGIHKGKHDWS
jgi:hypothetical protein